MATIAQRVEALEDFRDNQQRPWNKTTSDRITALEAKVAKLEAGTTPTPPVPVPPVLTPSAPVTASTNGQVIEGLLISTTSKEGAGIRVNGKANVTIRNCTIKGWNVGILAEKCANLTIQDCVITDADYAGILTTSQTGGRIVRNLIQRIGFAKDLTTSEDNNAYGIALSNYSGDTVSSDVLVEGNTVEDVPLWHGLDTHNGLRITFKGNIVRRCARAIFITKSYTSPTDCVIQGNQFLEAKTKTGGTNATAATLYVATNAKFIDNVSSKSYGQPMIDDVLGDNSTWTETGTVYVA